MEQVQVADKGHWSVAVQVRKYHEDVDAYRGGRGFLRALRRGAAVEFIRKGGAALFEAEHQPYEVVDAKGNLLMNAGIQRMLDLLIGAGGQALNNANSRIGVGNSATAASASQTDLQAAAGSSNRWFQDCDATYPSRSSQTLTFQATFGASDGNFTWSEWCIDAGTVAGNTVVAPMLNRKVESLGAKTAGTWVLQVTITIS